MTPVDKPFVRFSDVPPPRPLIPSGVAPSERLRLANEMLVKEFMGHPSTIETMMIMRVRAKELGVDCGPFVQRFSPGSRTERRWLSTGDGLRDGYWQILRVPSQPISVDWERIIVCLPAQADLAWNDLQDGVPIDAIR